MKGQMTPGICNRECEADEYRLSAQELPLLSSIDSDEVASPVHLLSMTQVDMWNRVQEEAEKRPCEGYGKIPTKVMYRVNKIMCPVVARVLGEMGYVE